MRRIVAVIGLVAVAVLGLAACDPAVRCGGVITKDTKVTKDVLDCAGDGLSVGADHITIDLNGHTISSVGGVALRIEGHRGVRVRNGTVEGTVAGLAATDAEQLTLEGLVVHGEDAGMHLERVTDSVVRQTTAHAMDGFVLVDSHRNRLQDSRAPGDADTGHGLLLEGSDRNRVLANRFTNGGNDSILLVDSHENELVDNDASGSNGVGITLSRSDRTVLRRNAAGSEIGAIGVIESDDTLIEDTEMDGPGNGEPDAISVRGSARTRLIGNHVGDLIVQGSTATTVRDNLADRIVIGGSGQTELDGNTVTANPRNWTDPEYGVVVAADSLGSIVRGNVVTGFLVDGIAIDAPGTQVRRNTADQNGRYGIAAVVGVVDGGGNRATGNGGPAQCLNVVCS